MTLYQSSTVLLISFYVRRSEVMLYTSLVLRRLLGCPIVNVQFVYM